MAPRSAFHKCAIFLGALIAGFTTLLNLNVLMYDINIIHCHYQRKKVLKMLLQPSQCKVLCYRKRKRRRPRFWIRPGRSSLWWDNFMNGKVIAKEWNENFRMSTQSFMELCNELRPYITKKTTVMRNCLSPEKQLAITL